ncbi:MAG: cytochrome c biogenesis protein CcdA [Methylococcales bacterium]
MKNYFFLFFLWLLSTEIILAAIPKAELSITPTYTMSWPAQYQLSLFLPKNHHAYLDSGDTHSYLPITIDPQTKLAASGLTISKLEKPTGVYDHLVKATVLRGKNDFKLWLMPANQEQFFQNTTVISLEVEYQLCNEITNVCFRPQTARQELTLPSASMNTIKKAPGNLMDSLLLAFKHNQNNNLLIFFLMFFAGVLSVATPCVYPMLPITSMFILNRANGNAAKESQHALVYLVGIIGTYMLLGLIAGITGGAFNVFMQSAWVNIAFAAFFTFFALALLGFFELGFMQNEVHMLDQHSARVKGLTGTWLMGSLAGLVISPCVGPIVFALLLQVADNIAAKADAVAALGQPLYLWDKFSIAAEGSLLMAGFGLGVGVPFFLVSVVKFKMLPKAGYWLNKIKYAFGCIILYFAFSYLEKGMGVLNVAPSTTLYLAIGLLVVWLAVVHCNVLAFLPTDAQPNQKMFHYFGVITLIVGGWLIIVSLGQLPLVQFKTAALPGLKAVSACTDPTTGNGIPLIEQDAGISWYRSFATAQKIAQDTHKPIFIDFYASWCANCVAFKAETANNAALNKALRERVVAVRLVDKEPEFESFRENPDYRALKIGLPYFAILTNTSKLIWSGTDHTAMQQMIDIFNKFVGDGVVE